jgi:hypothetical protein
MTPVLNKQPQFEDSCVAHIQRVEPGSDSRLRVTVLVTTKEGTLAALRAAQDLARNLGVRVALVAVEVVSIHFPLDRPAVSVDFLEQRSLALLRESGVDAEEVSAELYLCRDRKQCLQLMLIPRSLIIMGGKRGWRARQEKKVEQWLRDMGHQVIFIDIKEKRCVQPGQLIPL